MDQRDYTLFTEADLQLCITSSVTICPAKPGPGGTPASHHTLPPGERLVLPHHVSRGKRNHTQRVRLSHRPQEIRTLPVLSKTEELPLDVPQLFLPDRVPAVASHELAKIESAMSPETSGLDYVKERLFTPRQAFDVDTLLHVHQKSVHAARESH